MSSYLDIAEQVLDGARKPLTPREILARAYSARLMPYHLYGKTQHKTIQARISEDILRKRESSVFFRPKPGQFFLRKYIQDSSIPMEYRTPIISRRRTRDLLTGPALAISAEALDRQLNGRECINAVELQDEIPSNAWTYVDPKNVPSNLALVWSAAIVVRGRSILAYRTGRYRDDRDTFANKQTISFTSLVSDSAMSLFDLGDLGIRESALRAAVVDLDIPLRPTEDENQQIKSALQAFVRPEDSFSGHAVLAMVLISCPNWFEPVSRRLSLNDLRWVDVGALPNNLEDYDPWSRLLWRKLAESDLGEELRGLG